MIKGKVWKYKDNVDTDVIIPARYLNDPSEENLKAHCMEDIDSNFSKNVEKGHLMVVGENFGCGSSREHAPLSIKVSGVSIVIAKSFARIFYRNAINIGLPILECREAVDGINEGDIVSVDTDNGIIYNETTNVKYTAKKFPEFLQEIIKAGSYLEYLKNKKNI